MKKILYSVALAALALVASCQREVAPKELTPADFATVTFAIDAAQPGTKAVADGLTATKLYVGVYDVTAESKFMGDISELGTLTLAAGKYDFSVRLVKGQSYKLVFWAQAPDAPYTVTIGQEGATVVATTTGAGSAENRDAFFKTVETGVVGEDFALPVKLERAVAQVNVIANDWTEAAAAGVTYTGASMSIAGLPDTIDLLTGTYSGSATYAFTSAAAPAENFGDRKWIASNYVLAADEEGLKAVEFVVDGAVNGAAKQWSYAEADKVNNVAITRNYRTNISGNLFTASATFNVVVDPIFATPDNEKEIEVAKDVTATNAALEANMEVTGPVAYVIETVKVDDTTIIIPEGTQASDLTFTIASFDKEITAPTITINDGGTTAAYAGNITVNLPTDVDVNLVTINAPGAHVTISNGTITKVVAATSGTTLVIASEAKVVTLEVASGNIDLAGKVDNIVRAEGNTDEVTYVSLVEGYTWTNQAADTAEGTKVVVKVDDPSEEASEEPSDEPAGDEVFAKATSVAAGEYLIVYEEGAVAFNGGLETLDAIENSIAVTITEGTIAANKETKAAVFTLEAVEGGYAVKAANGQYIGQTSDANGLVAGETAIVNTVSISEGEALIGAAGAYLRYNSASNQLRFRYYKSSSYANQKPVALYKLVGASTETSEDPSQEPVEESDIVAAVTESLVIDLGGEDAQIEVEVSDPAEGAAVAYASADEQVVTVSKDGVVHAVAAGETTVTVTITAEGYKPLEKVVDVTVLEPTVNPSDDPVVEEIKVVTVAEFLAEDPFTDYTTAQKYQLTGTITSIANTTYGNIYLEDETGSIYVYGLTATEQGLKSNTTANNDKSFASLNLKAGDTVTIVGYRYVYASSNTDQVLGAYYVSHVAGDAITELTFKASATVEVGKTVDIAATNNVNAPVVYVSGDESIVTVSEAGVITGISIGSTTVTAKVVAVPGQYTGAEKVCNVTVAPASSGGKAAVGTTLWAETWEGGSASATPATYSQSGTTVYGTANVTYTFDGGQSTKLYIDNNMDGSTSQENLLLAKASGTWTISGIPTGGATKVLLKYYVNNNSGISTKCAVSSSTATVGDQTAGEENAKPFSYTHEITVTGLTTFDLTFSNTNSSNVRLDDLSIVVVE